MRACRESRECLLCSPVPPCCLILTRVAAGKGGGEFICGMLSSVEYAHSASMSGFAGSDLM